MQPADTWMDSFLFATMKKLLQPADEKLPAICIIKLSFNSRKILRAIPFLFEVFGW
jgi:hypothetical protein